MLPVNVLKFDFAVFVDYFSREFVLFYIIMQY